MRLLHIHIPTPTPASLASRIQSLLVQRHIDFHHLPPSTSPSSCEPPRPTLLTFSTPPTYTSGRRQSLSPSQINHLTHGPSSSSPLATYAPSPRGGLLTFHGPGQLTAYLVLHLRTHRLSPRCYVRFLEASLIKTLAAYGVEGFTREEFPGVWVGEGEKVVSVGVHVRRGVTGFGAGVNVSTEKDWWERVVACGIEGVKMVGLTDLGVREVDGVDGVRKVGEVLAMKVAGGLGLEDVEVMQEGDKRRLIEEAKKGEAVH